MTVATIKLTPANVAEIAWRTGAGVVVLLFAGLLLIPQTALYLFVAIEQPLLPLALCSLSLMTWVLSVAGFVSSRRTRRLRRAATSTGALWFAGLAPLVFLWAENNGGGGDAPWVVYAILLSFPGCVLLSLCGIWLATPE